MNKKNLGTILIVIIVALLMRGTYDWYKYGTFMHWGRMQNMMTHMGGNPMMMQHSNIASEEEFIKHMIPHHQEAVDTASTLNVITQSPELKKLTADIASAQAKEIAMMQQWLQNRYATGTVQVSYQPMMRDTSTMSAIGTIEKIWLEDMIKHHMGAVMMAEQVLQLNPRPEVAAFANGVIVVQNKEIQDMSILLQNYK